MMIRSSAQESDRQAAEWLARRDAGLSSDEQQAFEAWLAADARHLGAYARLETALAQFERLGAAGKEQLQLSPEEMPWLTRRRVILSGSVAAGLAVTAFGAVMVRNTPGQESYTTKIGETQVVPLQDGSVITLNTNSKVVVRYSPGLREIQLTRGEALFDVAKNKKRPFIVLAGDTQVRAVGTSFTVKLLPAQPVQVLVQEGIVEIKRPQVPEAAPVQLVANTRAVAPAAAPIVTQVVSHVQVARDLAWREGRISFDNETLKEAAEEFSRYSDIQIAIDPTVADQTITGLFISNDPVGFARAAAISLDLHADITDKEVRISR